MYMERWGTVNEFKNNVRIPEVRTGLFFFGGGRHFYHGPSYLRREPIGIHGDGRS